MLLVSRPVFFHFPAQPVPPSSLFLLGIDTSALPREERVWCLLLVKRQRQHCHFPLIPQPVGCVCVCGGECIFCISPPDHISFNTTALAQRKLVELVLQVIVCLWGKLCFTDAAESTQLAGCLTAHIHTHNLGCRHLKLCIHR